MTIEQTLLQRSNSSCELCSAQQNLTVYDLPPNSDGSADQAVLVCNTCHSQIQNQESMDVNHWRCLNDSMWNPISAVQVMAWRILKRLSGESEGSWAQDLLDMLYLEEEIQAWAETDGATEKSDDSDPTLDSNGAVLQAGDTVTLIKDLVVKGANFTAKRGTAVRNISLTDNPQQIEGRVNGTRIVLLTQFLKKAN